MWFTVGFSHERGQNSCSGHHLDPTVAMARKPEDLWKLHSLVASYVMPSRRLCQALLQKSVHKAAVHKLIGAIQPDPKIRKEKAYYFFGIAYIASHESETKLNPLQANWHHRFVRHADAFHGRLKELGTGRAASFDFRKAATIAKDFRPGFSQCTLQRLKTEVEAACKLMNSASNSPVGKRQATAKRRDDVGPGQARDLVTVSELAAEWRCGSGKIYTLIRKGELHAANMSTGPGKRPRYMIHRRDIEQCLQNRAVVSAAVEQPRKRRPNKPDGVIEYF
jgi:Helix-turn-helix domain